MSRFLPCYYYSLIKKKQDMEITTMNEETERVSADLLATSVSKAVLAKEVLRLKQVYSIFM